MKAKKLTALAIAGIMTLGSLPITAFANHQVPVVYMGDMEFSTYDILPLESSVYVTPTGLLEVDQPVPELYEHTYLRPEKVELAIEALYYYGRLDENGIPTFDQVPFYVFYEFGHDLINDLIQTASRFDAHVLSGEITFNEDLTIAADYLEIVPFNNRNRNAVVVTLFTNRFYMSRATTTTAIRNFRDLAVLSGAGAGLSVMLPIAGKPATAAFIVNGTSSQLKANRLQDRLNDSTSFGTILVLHGVTLGVTFTTHVQ